MKKEIATHHGKLGDIIYAGPAMRAKGIRKLIIFNDEQASGMKMTKFHADFLAPLLTAQDWCDTVKFRDSDVPYSHLPGFRHHNRMHSSSLIGHHLSTYSLHDVAAASEIPWLKVKPKELFPLVINRTPRWLDKVVDHELNYGELMAAYENKACFVGTATEHEDFQDQHGTIPHVAVKDSLELAEVIAGAQVFVGTPSLCAAIACGLRQTTVLECAAWFNAGWERPECAIMHNGSTLTPTHLDTVIEIGQIVKRRYWQ
jgi:hypothetical protein